MFVYDPRAPVVFLRRKRFRGEIGNYFSGSIPDGGGGGGGPTGGGFNPPDDLPPDNGNGLDDYESYTVEGPPIVQDLDQGYGWTDNWVLDPVDLGVLGHDPYDTYTVEDAPLTQILDGGFGFPSEWSISLWDLGVRGLETWELYAVDPAPIGQALDKSWGWSAAWVVDLNYSQVRGMDDFQSYSVTDPAPIDMDGGFGFTGAWVLNPYSTGDPNQSNGGEDDFEGYDEGPLGSSLAHGQFNYVNFLNWDVIGGTVDLVGSGFWDLFPGNGLYVDMAGTPGLGTIRSKTDFSFSVVGSYKLSLRVAGNNRIGGTDVLKVSISGGVLPVQTITKNSTDPFSLHEFTFTSSSSGKITILTDSTPYAYVGPVIDSVLLERLDVPTVLLDDDFDSENVSEVSLPFAGTGWLGVWDVEQNYLGILGSENFESYGAGVVTPDLSGNTDLDGGIGWTGAWFVGIL